MKRLLAFLLISGVAMAAVHIPEITPSDDPKGDVPPEIEPTPLPPIMFEHPVTHVPVVLLPW